ncbi:TVP38/TMEM64 family protein [bacterium]|nr:TVP38/TMEM64 family protein [bacterium]
MRKGHIIGAAALVFFLVVIILFYFFDGARFFSLALLQKHSFDLLQFVQKYYALSLFLYSILFISVITFSLPVTGPLTLLSGFLFGMIPGFFVSLASATVGATLAFLLLRKNINEVVHSKYGKHLETFKRNTKEYGIFYVLILHFSTVVPYAIINILAALSGLRVRTVVWTTAVGFLPIAFIYTLAGNKFASIKSMNDIFSTNILMIFALLIAVMIIPLIIKRIMGRKYL